MWRVLFCTVPYLCATTHTKQKRTKSNKSALLRFALAREARTEPTCLSSKSDAKKWRPGLSEALLKCREVLKFYPLAMSKYWFQEEHLIPFARA